MPYGLPGPIYSNFNPRTRAGCDAFVEIVTAKLRNFNPRTREGCDRVLDVLHGMLARYFNPRTREGCDLLIVKSMVRKGWTFQSTHP